MNFKNMPEYDWAWGYQYGWTVIILSALIPLIWFKLKGYASSPMLGQSGCMAIEDAAVLAELLQSSETSTPPSTPMRRAGAHASIGFRGRAKRLGITRFFPPPCGTRSCGSRERSNSRPATRDSFRRRNRPVFRPVEMKSLARQKRQVNESPRPQVCSSRCRPSLVRSAADGSGRYPESEEIARAGPAI
jgi:hypothetical protein